MNSGHLRIIEEWRDSSAGASRKFTYTIWFQGSLIRQDRETNGVVDIECSGDVYHYSFKRGLGPFALTATKLDHFKTDNLFIIDPRRTMMHPTSVPMAYAFHLDFFVGSPNRDEFALEQINWEGEPAVAVSFRMTLSGSRVVYWVVPGRSHNIVRMQRVGVSPEITIDDSVKCTLQRINGDQWFPKHIEQRRLENGTPTKTSEADIEVMSLNQPVAAECFTPASMSVPIGTSVTVIPQESLGSLKWDGKQIVPLTNDELSARMERAQGPMRRAQAPAENKLRTLLFAASGLFALLGCAIVWWLSSRKVRGAQSG